MHRIYLLICFSAILFGFSPAYANVNWPPDSAYIDDVIGHPQQHNLSCESRSASDWAAFFGVEVSENEILAALPRSDNPNYGFVGNPDGTWGNIPPYSYGVHSNPIENVLVSYGMPVYGERNLTWDFVRAQIASGRPVIVWVIGRMWPGTPIEYTDSQGRTAIVAYYEHTMILIGYDSATVWAVDASNGETSAFPLSSFLDSWAVLQNMGAYYRIDYDHNLYLPFVIKNDGSAFLMKIHPSKENEAIFSTSVIPTIFRLLLQKYTISSGNNWQNTTSCLIPM